MTNYFSPFQRRMPPLLLLICASYSATSCWGTAFCAPPLLVSRPNAKVSAGMPQSFFGILFATAANGDDQQKFDFDAGEVEEMEDLIVSLSKEPTDDSRRSRLVSVFEGHDARFASLFDEVLIVVGDRVRLEAERNAVILEQEKQARKDDDDDNNDELPSFPLPGQKTEAEFQLWALIDMMVQSKTIVKRAAGQLGSEGSFG